MSVPYLRAHADVFEWNKRRAQNMDALYQVLVNELAEHFDPSQLSQKDIINALKKFSGHVDRLQGRIVERQQIDQRKMVTFVAIPLAGGSPPILPESKQKVLAPGTVIDAQFLPETPDGEKESFTDPRVGLTAEDVAGTAARSLAETEAKDRRSSPSEEKGPE